MAKYKMQYTKNALEYLHQRTLDVDAKRMVENALKEVKSDEALLGCIASYVTLGLVDNPMDGTLRQLKELLNSHGYGAK